MRKLAFGLVFVSAIGVAAAGAQTPPPVELKMVELPVLPGYDWCTARAINNLGQVIGACDRSAPTPASHAVMWEDEYGVAVDLGTLDGGVGSFPLAINDKGQIVGQSLTQSGNVEAFLWERDGGIQSIAKGDDPSSTTQTASARAINQAGQIVGRRGTVYFDGSDPWTGTIPFLREADGSLTDIGKPGLMGTQANAINEQGQVLIGTWDWSPQPAAWLWTGAGDPIRLKPLSGRPFDYQDPVYAADLNDSGLVVGSSESGQGVRATRWTTAEPVEILTPADPSTLIHSWALGLNQQGQIIGSWMDADGSHGFFRDGTVATELGFLGSGRSIQPTALNNLGQVVGVADVQSPQQGVRNRAFLWQEGVLSDLGSLSAEGESMAFDINELGQAVGESRTAAGNLRAVLWTPPLSPEHKIEALIRRIEALVEHGELAKGPGNALVVSLKAALEHLEGNAGTACNVLHAFTNKVKAFVKSGTLSEADGAALLTAVNAIIAELCG